MFQFQKKNLRLQPKKDTITINEPPNEKKSTRTNPKHKIQLMGFGLTESFLVHKVMTTKASTKEPNEIRQEVRTAGNRFL